MNEFEILNRSVKDFFTKPMLKIALYPLVITLIVLYISFFVVADNVISSLEDSTINIKQTQVENFNGQESVTTIDESYSGEHIIDYLLSNPITSGILSFLIYTVGSMFIMMFSLFVALIIIGFLTPMILSKIRDIHYPDVKFDGYGNMANSVGVLVKSIFVMIGLFIVLIPFYFIPLINIIVINIPFFYFFHKMLNFDVASTVMSEDKAVLIKHKYKNILRIKSLGLYLISMIPFVALFTTVFFVIYYGHTYISKMKATEVIE